MYRGLLVALLHCLLVLSLAGKYAWDRATLPKVWVNVTPVDPNLPVRGRYLSLNVHVNPSGDIGNRDWFSVTLSIVDGKLVATPSQSQQDLSVYVRNDTWLLSQPVAFYVPEHAADPSPTLAQRAQGEELWAEVSLPPQGEPRPIRLALKRNGVLQPVDLR